MAVGCGGGSRLAGHADLNFWLEIERQMAVPSPGQPTRLPLMAVRPPTPGLHRPRGRRGSLFRLRPPARPGRARVVVAPWPATCVCRTRSRGGRPPRSRHRPSVLFRATPWSCTSSSSGRSESFQLLKPPTPVPFDATRQTRLARPSDDPRGREETSEETKEPSACCRARGGSRRRRISR